MSYVLSIEMRDNPRPAPGTFARDEACARKMFDTIWAMAPYIVPRKTEFTNWAKTIRLMRERDGHSYEEIWQLFLFANSDRNGNGEFPGWAYVILSPDKLRTHWVTLSMKLRHARTRSEAGVSASGLAAALSVGRD